MGYWLGEAYDIGQAMCYWILPISGTPIARSTMQKISDDQKSVETVMQELHDLETAIEERFKSEKSEIEEDYNYLDEDQYPRDYQTPSLEPYDPKACMPEADDYDAKEYDQYINAEVILPKGEAYLLGTVTQRKRDMIGNPIGKYHTNPIFDTCIYEFQFPDGHSEEFTANTIAECLYSQVDNEWNQYLLIDEIINWQITNESLNEENELQISSNNKIYKCRTTKGWELCVLWKDGSTSWEKLKDMKEGFPIQVVEFAVSRGLENWIAFKWWVPYIIKRRNRMIKAMKTTYIKRTHKYGIRLPKSVEDAYEIDRESNTDFWHRAILKEMTNNAIAFKFLEDGQGFPSRITMDPMSYGI
jgi:hypothetical protein